MQKLNFEEWCKDNDYNPDKLRAVEHLFKVQNNFADFYNTVREDGLGDDHSLLLLISYLGFNAKVFKSLDAYMQLLEERGDIPKIEKKEFSIDPDEDLLKPSNN